MPITGGAKFFSPNVVLSADGGTITASSGELVAVSAIDKNPITFWNSVGSDDATQEELVLTFDESQMDRLLLQDFNFKEFNVKYWDGAVWADFTNVVGLDGTKVAVSETAFADDSAYYEFTAVTTTKLRVQVLKTQVVDEEKYLCQVIACTEIATLQGFPQIRTPTHSRNQRNKDMLSGKVLVQKGIDSFQCKIQFENYPPSLSADIDAAMTLFDREDPFLVWLCGGRRGSSYFRYALRGFRLKDVYLMQITKDVGTEYLDSVYVNPVNLQLTLEEHV